MAMRMWEIAKFLIIVELVIVFTNGIGLFDHNYYTADQGTGTKYTYTDIEGTINANKQVTSMDYFDMAVGFVMAGLNLLLAVMNIFFLLPSLANTFKIPIPIIAIIQTVVYLEIVYGVAQWKASRPGGLYE